MAERGIPTHSLGRAIKELGQMRVTDGSKRILKLHLEDDISKIAERAIIYMKHARRKTILVEDVELAIKDLTKE